MMIHVMTIGSVTKNMSRHACDMCIHVLMKRHVHIPMHCPLDADVHMHGCTERACTHVYFCVSGMFVCSYMVSIYVYVYVSEQACVSIRKMGNPCLHICSWIGKCK